MKIVMLSKALVSGAYQKKLEELARRPEVDLLALVPPAWHEPRVGTIRLERRFTQGYRLEVLPIMFNGQHHLHFYPGLRRVLQREQPDLLHIDEESFNPATCLALRDGRSVGARCCFYNYANNDRYYPPPFNLFERYAFRHAAYALVCNQEAAQIIRRHGYAGPIAVLPQFGVDPDLFYPVDEKRHPTNEFIVGYVGRLVREKGVLDLVEALVGLPERVRLRLVGAGAQRPQIERRVDALGLHGRVELRPAVASTAVPAMLRELDALVLPSHTMPNWKEQFGRILIEAMSSGVPVVGSSSGEIPNVIGAAGLVFPEGDVPALRNCLARLLRDAVLWQRVREQGRTRVLAYYTQSALAHSYYDIYRKMLMASPTSYPR